MAKPRLFKRNFRFDFEAMGRHEPPEGLMEVGDRVGSFIVVEATALSEKDERTWFYIFECPVCRGRWKVPHESAFSNEVCSTCPMEQSSDSLQAKRLYVAHVEACMKYGIQPQKWENFRAELERDDRANGEAESASESEPA